MLTRAFLRVLPAVAVVLLFAIPAQAESDVEKAVSELLGKMSLSDKVGQMCLGGRGSTGSYSPLPDELLADVKAGRLGAVINVMERDFVQQLQKLAVEESPHGIPLLFGRDVIHGFKTVFPIPLGQAAMWDVELVREAARASAVEASRFGVNWAFAPMLDVSRDARWGRIAESFGEDPFLTEVLGVAMVQGLQGDSLADPNSLAACVKHFAAYGAAEGGRDYNTVSVPEGELRNIYLRPFDAALKAGAASVMSGFNELNGVPATGNAFLLDQVLRQEWSFDGFVVSDWSSVTEMIAHGTSLDAADAARQAASAGTDMDMMSGAYAEHLERLVTEGKVDESRIDAAVAGILRVKMRLGLFDDPYRPSTAENEILELETTKKARRAVARASVLLKNEGNVLPFSDEAKVALIGPLAEAPHEQLGTWSFDGQKGDSLTLLTALRVHLEGQLVFVEGLETSRDTSRDNFSSAMAAARAADFTVFVGGEEAILSGEAHSRADIRLPGAQEDMIREIAKVGKPLILVILAGRPIALDGVLDHVDAVLMSWHPGTEGGAGISDILLGDVEPGGRLPVTWPKEVGQIPIYYNHKNTGRPADPAKLIPIEKIPEEAWQSSLSNTSHYLDLGKDPRFPFGYGLTFTRFEYSDLKVEPAQVTADGTITVSAEVKNVGERKGSDVAQLYFRDEVASLTRPVRELAGFERVELEPGESRRVTLEVPVKRLGFWNNEGEYRLEPGSFGVWIGPNAAEGLEGRFELVASEEGAEGETR